jgi:hypothetical protein
MIPSVLPRPTNRWRRHADVYRFFAERACLKRTLDFSEEAARAAFNFESNGIDAPLSRNAYAVGKHWANVQVEEWRGGIADRLFLRAEFLEDEDLTPIRWWVEEVLP